MNIETAHKWAIWYLLTNGGKTGQDHDVVEFLQKRKEIIEALVKENPDVSSY